MNYISQYVPPPPPPPGCDVVQLPVTGLTLEVDHADKRNNLLESIRDAGGFEQARLKHVPEDHQHLPGKPRPPPSLLPTGSGPGKNKMAGAGRGDLMNDLNAVLHNRKLGRGMGKKQFICHVPLLGQVRHPGHADPGHVTSQDQAGESSQGVKAKVKQSDPSSEATDF